MTTENGIRIQNIYYMLSYAFSVLKDNGYEKLKSDKFENTADLLAAILSKGIAVQLKRGLGKEYVDKTEPLSTLRGKIDISQSIKSQTMIKKQLVCNFDEFSVNTKYNQILKTTAHLLIKSKYVPTVRKNELKKLMLFFTEIDMINTHTIDWNMRFNRNNQSYQMLISICYLVVKGLIQKDEHGDMKMQKFLDEQNMSNLYEKFILEYYKKYCKKHYPKLKVSASHIGWKIEEGNEFISLLPQMKSDIMIRDKDANKTLIIDAKFYSRGMSKHYLGDKNTFHSNNLYQIFTYVKNFARSEGGDVSGMLLYAKTDVNFAEYARFDMNGNLIFVDSLDLSGEFEVIEDKLNGIVEKVFKN